MPLYLADTSAWTRSGATLDVALRWAELMAGRNLAICCPVELEILYSARGPREYEQRRGDFARLPRLPLDQRAESAAVFAQASLAARSQHRGPTPVDVLIAAIAEVNGATVLHYDRHFDAIQRVTGQPMEWLARRGSLD